jgi:aspartate/methionine/tyrosine aminotransferase
MPESFIPPAARRLDRIEPFHVMDILARAREYERAGRSIIHMEVGEPDFPTPGPIVEAAIRALRAGETHYTPALGLTALREAIAAHYREREGVEVAPERIVVTPGASGAMQLALAVLLDPGDRVLMADPGYPCNRHFVRLFEAEPVGVPVGPEHGYQLTAAMVARRWDAATAGVMLASPSNPTGTLIEPAALAAIVEEARRRGGFVLVDEIYHGLVYGEAGGWGGGSALALGEDVFVVNSFSKYFNMTGWRLGWLVAPRAFVPKIDRLAQNLFLAASTPAQHAALAAFEPGTLALLEARRRELGERRDYLLAALRGLGFRIPLVPQGAFYLYADCAGLAADSRALAAALLDEAGVAVTPGLDFGVHRAAAHLRFAYTTSLDNLRSGVERIGRWLGR